jgi:DNA-binding GntR family transcriptional regulator
MTLRGKPAPLLGRAPLRAPHAESASALAEAVRPRQAPPTPTLASIVQQKIVSDIAHGALPPGLRLEEEDLARRYHVSRTPVREALRQLSALGIVEMRHRQGVVVASRSVEHFQNLLEIVADLEASAARYAAQRMTDVERQKLSVLHTHIGGIAAQSAVTRFDKANSTLHQLIHEGAHNKILLNGIVQMRMRTLPYTRIEFISEKRRMEISHMEHNAIVTAILRHEPEMAYHAMRLHVIEAGNVQEDVTPPRS